MTDTIDFSKARRIEPSYDNRGEPTWASRMSQPDDSFGWVVMVSNRIVPVIFVPGVMGSNLVQTGVDANNAVRWRLDNVDTATDWATPSRNAAFRRRFLNPATMAVDDRGAIPQGTQIRDEELRRRGWGEIGALSYSEILVWLELALSDLSNASSSERNQLTKDSLEAVLGESPLTQDEVALSHRYRFPVHAFGYNWLASNADSAAKLGKRIDEVVNRYKNDGKKCEKVIIVTHSMGGLVARHCSEVLGYRNRILGIVHGVMPAIGAAAVYRRFKAGTENAGKGMVGSLKGWVGSEALGADAAEMTAVLSNAPGPLQLLPTPEYGNGWLTLRDRSTSVSLPKNGDPYGEIYTVRDKWWSMCEADLINPLNTETDPKRRKAQTDADWGKFKSLIDTEVVNFQASLIGKYHPNTHAFVGSHADNKAYGTVTWLAMGDRGVQVPCDFMSGTLSGGGQISTTRVVDAQAQVLTSSRGGPPVTSVRTERRRFTLSEPDENGDGTVPHHSGLAPKNHCKSFLQVNVGHEPAYKVREGADYRRACRFTLRAIVKIAQSVKQTSLKYD